LNGPDLLELLLHGNQLKRTARTGWAQRGIANPEDVAAHSYGVAFTALALAELVAPRPDLAAVLVMALLHDLPEGLTSDIPTPAWRYLPRSEKKGAERRALEDIVAGAPFAPGFLRWWDELVANETVEARLVHDADKLDQVLQAFVYERQTGNRQLAEFWTNPHVFHTAEAQAVYDELVRRRAAGE
jgi:putative hydrolase of HD superfamily